MPTKEDQNGEGGSGESALWAANPDLGSITRAPWEQARRKQKKRGQEETPCGLQSQSGGQLRGTLGGRFAETRGKRGQEEPAGGLESQNGGRERGTLGGYQQEANGRQRETVIRYDQLEGITS